MRGVGWLTFAFGIIVIALWSAPPPPVRAMDRNLTKGESFHSIDWPEELRTVLSESKWTSGVHQDWGVTLVYQGDARQLNELLAKFATLDSVGTDVMLHPRVPGEKETAAGWAVLIDIDSPFLSRPSQFSVQLVVHVYLTDHLLLSDLAFPVQTKLHVGGQLGDLLRAHEWRRDDAAGRTGVKPTRLQDVGNQALFRNVPEEQ